MLLTRFFNEGPLEWLDEAELKDESNPGELLTGELLLVVGVLIKLVGLEIFLGERLCWTPRLKAGWDSMKIEWETGVVRGWSGVEVGG